MAKRRSIFHFVKLAVFACTVVLTVSAGAASQKGAPKKALPPPQPANAIESLVWLDSDMAEVDNFLQMNVHERTGAVLKSAMEIERLWRIHGVNFCPPSNVEVAEPEGNQFKLIDKARNCVNSIVQSTSKILSDFEKQELFVQVAFYAHVQRILKMFQRAEDQKIKGQKSSRD